MSKKSLVEEAVQEPSGGAVQGLTLARLFVECFYMICYFNFMIKKKLLYGILIVCILGIGGIGLLSYRFLFTTQDTIEKNETVQFRDLVVKLVREDFLGKTVKYPKELEIEGDWRVSVKIYHQGEIKGEGTGKSEILSLTLEEATKNTLEDKRLEGLDKKDLEEARFLIEILVPGSGPFSFIEYEGKGKELLKGDLVAVRNLDKELIRQKIIEGKEYLLRVIDKNEHGVHKYYYALDDSFEDRLHTIYTSSLIYTLLKIYEPEKDESLLEQIFKCGDLILSMQNKEEGTKGYGAFYYSYYLKNKEKEKKFVVGTTSKTIFTLLELYKLTGDAKYLESAKLGANWLITMQKPDGSMKSYLRYTDEKWVHGTKESFLYNGQVLSALSRLYNISKEKNYYQSAEKIAKNFAKKIEEEGCYLGDDYRPKNPISSSWVVLSLLDFYKISGEEYYKNLVLKCSDDLLKRQITKEDDVIDNGRWEEAYSTSGVGWIAEVVTEIYSFCKEEKMVACDEYKEAVVRAIRWLIQNTYSKENTFFLKNPEKAIGGLFWDYNNKYVRTDSVCHGLNAYLNIINDLEEGLLLSIPEKPLERN